MFMLLLLSELIPKQISLGCFQEKKSARLLNIKFGSFSSSYDAQDPTLRSSDARTSPETWTMNTLQYRTLGTVAPMQK